VAITDPNGIVNLWTWVDAEVGVDDPRSQLTNQDNGIPDTDRNLVQPDAGLRPALTDFGGIDAVEFAGTEFMYSTESANRPQVTISTVIRVPTTPVDGSILWHSVASLNKPFLSVTNAATTPTLAFASPFVAGLEIEPDDDWAWGEAMVVTWTYNTTPDLLVARVNGVEKGDVTMGGVGSFDDVYWGGTLLGGVPGTFLGMAAVAYDRVLNATELDDLDAWMADTYVVNPPPPPPPTPAGVSNVLGVYNPILFI